MYLLSKVLFSLVRVSAILREKLVEIHLTLEGKKIWVQGTAVRAEL